MFSGTLVVDGTDQWLIHIQKSPDPDFQFGKRSAFPSPFEGFIADDRRGDRPEGDSQIRNHAVGEIRCRRKADFGYGIGATPTDFDKGFLGKTEIGDPDFGHHFLQNGS